MIFNRNNQSKWISLIFFLLICFSVEIVGGLFTKSTMQGWYVHLHKASWNPAAWVFGPVWTVLYILIAISGWTVFCKPTHHKKSLAFFAYGLQLALNLLWTYSFFYLKSPLFGLMDLIALLVAVIWTMILFSKISRRASFLLIPYLMWIIYAGTLNAAIVSLNPAL